ncbi:MAG: SMP-30/gluconolactonase/LRE family protein [Planctomycetes bacterium]|nr:SMP-30/gluconolactonase/LRE family protein [Planctomycetota bacterium]
MKACKLWAAVVLSVGIGSAAFAADAPESIAGLGPVGPVTKLFGDFQFTEGPAADRAGNVYFTDIPAQRIHKIDAQGKLSTFREESSKTNGLMVNGRNELLGCEMLGRIVAMPLDGKPLRVLASEYQGQPFNAPNDLVVDRAGGVYFTDPHFGRTGELPQKVTAVYYVDPAGKVSRLVDDLKAPNGVILSPDEKTLYVVPSGQAEMMAYPVTEPGKLGPGRVHCTLKQPAGQSGKGGDGLTVDERGNLYITSGLGLQVFSPTGEALGIIAIPEVPANVTFAGPEGKTLYVTARKSIYTVPMAVRGHVFPGG